jgi:Uma2 family endonuclease
MSIELLEKHALRMQQDGCREPTRLEMIVTTDIRPKVSYEELLKLCELNDVVNFEWDPDGTLYIMAPAAGGSSLKNANLTSQLWIWANTDGLGVVFDSSGGFILPDGKMRNPDATWIRRELWDALTKDQRERGFPQLMPDFVIELRSYGNTRKELQEKMRLYLANGLRLGWLIDPFASEVEIYRLGKPVESLKKPLTLSGEDVLPGFVLDLKGILFD